MADYSSHFEQLNTRVKKSLDHAWKIFGRVVARQSLVKLTSDLDDLRRRYVEFVSAETVDSSTFDTLGASEGTLAQTLTQDRAGFTSAEGQDWYTKSQADLQAMSDARRSLLKVDRARKDGARKFATKRALGSILGRMGKTETYVVRHPFVKSGTAKATTASTAPGRHSRRQHRHLRSHRQHLDRRTAANSGTAQPQPHRGGQPQRGFGAASARPLPRAQHRTPRWLGISANTRVGTDRSARTPDVLPGDRWGQAPSPAHSIVEPALARRRRSTPDSIAAGTSPTYKRTTAELSSPGSAAACCC